MFLKKNTTLYTTQKIKKNTKLSSPKLLLPKHLPHQNKTNLIYSPNLPHYNLNFIHISPLYLILNPYSKNRIPPNIKKKPQPNYTFFFYKLKTKSIINIYNHKKPNKKYNPKQFSKTISLKHKYTQYKINYK